MLRSRSDAALMKHVFNNFTPLEWKHKALTLQLALRFDFVLYDKKLLPDPELDDLIARYDHFCVYSFRRFALCDSSTLHEVMSYKERPIAAAKMNGGLATVRELLKRHNDAVFRYKVLEIMHCALNADAKNRTNSFSRFLDLVSLHGARDIATRFLVNWLWLFSKEYKQGIDFLFYWGYQKKKGASLDYFMEYKDMDGSSFVSHLNRLLGPAGLRKVEAAGRSAEKNLMKLVM